MRSKKTVNLGNLLLSLSEFIDLANNEISQHQQRTAYIALEIAKRLDIEPKMIKNIFIASLLHDIGAITIDEKVALHRFEHHDVNRHCVKGEILLGRVPKFSLVAALVRYHHRNWQEWDLPIETDVVIGSQIMNLADFVERNIDRKKYILHQRKGIIEKAMDQCGFMFHSSVMDAFNGISSREEFWFDMTSPRLHSFLYHLGPLTNTEIDFHDVEIISKLFRDIIDFKSPFTATHSSGVTAAAGFLAEKLGLTDHEIRNLRIAGNFHDLGKLFIPNEILDKEDALNEEEFDVIKSHTYYTYFIINSVSGLEPIAEWAAYHHEKINGTGYPFQCDEKRLTIGSRIISVADIFTALLEDRPYRKGLVIDEIVTALNDFTGNNEIDRNITQILISHIGEIYEYVSDVQLNASQFYRLRFSLIEEMNLLPMQLSQQVSS